MQNCFFANKKHDLIVEFITRKEGIHKIYLYIKNELVDDNPFFVHVSGDLFATTAYIAASSARSSTSNTLGLGPFASWPHLRQSSQQQLASTSPRSSRAALVAAAQLTANGANAEVASIGSADEMTSGGAAIRSSVRSLESNSADSLVAQQQQARQLNQPSSSSVCLAGLGNGTILCARKDSQFHFVITDKNIQGLCVYGSFFIVWLIFFVNLILLIIMIS